MASEPKRKKKQRRERKQDWESQQDTVFSQERKRHLRTDTVISEVAATSEIPEDVPPNALVVSRSRKWAFVLWNDGEVVCRIEDALVDRGASVLAPGDRVFVEEVEGEPWVRAVAARRSKLSRPASEHQKIDEQVFAANVDVLVVVAAAAKPAFKPGLVDRYLIAAEVGGVDPLLCINKMDLVDAPPAELNAYRDIGLRVIETSAETRAGLDELRGALKGKTSVFAGHSGVGKSSLLNALQPELDIAIREVSEATDRGKHTTTAARLYEFGDGIRVIDTPGIRALGLWKVSPEEVEHYFPEIAECGDACKFRDCTHTHEPKCAVREAVDAGSIARHRYDSYLRIRESLSE